MQSKQKGTLVLWNDDKGFDFVKPDSGEKDYFVHISAIKNYQKGVSRRPVQGDVILFDDDKSSGKQRRISSAEIEDLQGAPAEALSIAPPVAAPTVSRVHALLVKLLAFVPVLMSMHVLLRYGNPIPVAAYVFMTPLTILYYAEDKRRALNHQWRISNFYLHCFEIMGGWPGALLAQNEYRHKLRRGSYQYGFWGIVALHLLAWSIYLYFQFAPS